MNILLILRKSIRSVLTLCILLPNTGWSQEALIWEKYTGAISNANIPIMPDYSYAGYKRGEVGIPASSGFTIFDVTDPTYGAIPDDNLSDQAAIQAAIDAAEANGSGVVFFPPGEYLVNTDPNNTAPITINSSNIILKGSGSTAGGTIINMKNYMRLPSGVSESNNPAMFVFSQVGGSTITRTGSGTINRGSMSIPISPVSSFANAKYCRIYMNPTTEANDCLLEGKSTKDIWTQVNNGVFMDETHEIDYINYGTNEIFLKDPLIDTFKSTYAWKVSTNNLLENCGFEDIHFKANFLDQFAHHKDYIHDYGWKAVDMKNVAHSWVRRCRFSNVSKATTITGRSYASSILNILVDGNAGHALSAVGFRSTNILQGLIWDNTNNGQFHGADMSGGAAGSVVWRVDARKGYGLDLHGDMPRTNLIDLYTQVETENNGGNYVNLPNHLAGLVMWNIERTGTSNKSVNFWSLCGSNYCGLTVVNPIVVGYHGAANTTFSNTKYVESNGNKVFPESLYEAQLDHRLGSAPAWIAEVIAEYNSLKTLWTNGTGSSVDPNFTVSQLEITEVRTQGSDNANYDIIEIKGSPGFVIPSGIYLTSIGNTSNTGTVLTKLNISGRIFPDDGFMSIGRTVDSAPDFVDLGINFNSFQNQSIIITQGNAPPADIDTNDDGIIDATFWTEMINGIAFVEVPSDPSVTDYSGQLGIPSISNTTTPAEILIHIRKDPVTGIWTGDRLNQDVGFDTFGSANHSIVTSTISLTEDVAVASLTIESLGDLTVAPDVTLTVSGDIVNNGSLTFESGSSLIESGSSFSGTPLIFKRTTQHSGDALRHNLVGSPVTNFSIQDLGAQTYFSYDENSDQWIKETTNIVMLPGKGYSVVGKTDLMFEGFPNSGNINVSSLQSAFNLISNPYPCAIQIDNFFNVNSSVLASETLWLWNDGGSENGQRAQTDYITVNSLGEAQTGTTGAKSSSNFIDGALGSMQGFFVQTSPSGSNISFTDAMKQTGNNADDAFFRKQEIDPQTLKLTISNDAYFSEALIGFKADATDDIDSKYDAVNLNGQSAVSIGFMIQNQTFAIAGFPLLLGNDFKIPLSVILGQVGGYVISAEDFKSLPETYNVFIYDQLVGVVSDLSDAYSFTAQAGISNDRFILILSQKEVYNVLNLEKLSEKVRVIGNSNGLTIRANQAFDTATIFDLQGKIFFSNNSLNFNNGEQHLDIQLEKDRIYIILLDNRIAVKFRL